MSTDTQSFKEYAVARADNLLTEPTADLEQTQRELDAIETHMRAAELEPDVRLVEMDVDVTTKRSRIRAYKEPQPDLGDTGESVTLAESGVWGDTGDAPAQD